MTYLSKFFVNSYKPYSTHPRLVHTTSRESLLSTFHPSLFQNRALINHPPFPIHTLELPLYHTQVLDAQYSLSILSVISLKYAFMHSSYQSCSANKSPYFQVNSTIYHLPTDCYKQVQRATKQDQAGGLQLRSEQSHREGRVAGGPRRGLL